MTGDRTKGGQGQQEPEVETQEIQDTESRRDGDKKDEAKRMKFREEKRDGNGRREENNSEEQENKENDRKANGDMKKTLEVMEWFGPRKKVYMGFSSTSDGSLKG